MAFAAVLFDWRGTLVVPPTLEEWVGDGLRRVGRAYSERHAQDLVTRITAGNRPVDRLDAPGIDADATLHRRIFMDVLSDAGIDAPLADALYASESDHIRNPFATDAASTIRALKAAGLRIGMVSDTHFDIRPAFAAAGLAGMIDSYSLSFEIGSQKPDAPIFTHALDSLELDAAGVLMVGDRSRPDGGAVELGIVTLLLPPLRSSSDGAVEGRPQAGTLSGARLWAARSGRDAVGEPEELGVVAGLRVLPDPAPRHTPPDRPSPVRQNRQRPRPVRSASRSQDYGHTLTHVDADMTTWRRRSRRAPSHRRRASTASTSMTALRDGRTPTLSHKDTSPQNY